MIENEKVSAWMDGEVEPDHCADLAAKVLADPALRGRWQEWHLLGDVLRSSSLAIGSSSVANRVSAQLASEPVHLPVAESAARPAAQQSLRARAARRSRFIYGGAIAAAVAFVSLVAFVPQTQTNFGELVASAVPGASPRVVAQPLEPVLMSDPRLSELLEAHGSMSIRTVSTEVR
jgi:sigma-E factor negative regulatory protein RseA